MYSYSRLRWDTYAACRRIFEDAFDISEIPSFVAAWPSRCEDKSIAAFYKGTLVAFALMDETMKLHYICVHPDFQNEGLGSILLAKVLELSSDERSIRLTTAGDERLVSWYMRYGFKVIDTTRAEGGAFIGADMVKRQHCRSK